MNEIKQKLKAADLVSLKLFCTCTRSTHIEILLEIKKMKAEPLFAYCRSKIFLD